MVDETQTGFLLWLCLILPINVLLIKNDQTRDMGPGSLLPIRSRLYEEDRHLGVLRQPSCHNCTCTPCAHLKYKKCSNMIDIYYGSVKVMRPSHRDREECVICIPLAEFGILEYQTPPGECQSVSGV